MRTVSPNRSSGPAGGSADQPGDASSGPLSRPSGLLQADPEQLSALTRDQEASRQALRSVAAEPSASPQDRVAAAVLLDAVLADPSAVEALDPEAAGSAEALGLRFSPQLRPSAARALGEQATMQLLTWAAQSSPGVPPVEAAEAAAHLGVDDDGRIYGRVSQRAVQIAEQKGLSRALKDRLRRLTDALGAADQQARRTRAEREDDGAAQAPQRAGASTAAAAGPASAPPQDAADGASETASRQDGGGVAGAPHGQDGRPPEAWTAADDDALASMLGRGPSDGPSAGQAPAGDAPAGDAPAGDAPSAPEAEQPHAPQAPDFGRPVGFDGGAFTGGSAGSSGSGGSAGPAEPTGQWPPPPRDRGIDGRSGTGPGYGASGTTGTEPPRSYDFRYLADDTAKPSTEAEKAEFRTTLRNWGLFALLIVVVLVIVGIII